MLAKRTRMLFVITLTLLISLLWVGAAPAQDLTGAGPDFAMEPTDQWMTLEPGQVHWYTFNFDYWGDEDAPRMEKLEFRLYTDPFDGAVLTVRNEQQVELWRQDGTHEWFGCAAPEELRDADWDADGKTDYALWAGEITTSGKYYIVIKMAAHMNQPVRYRFTMAGDGIVMPARAPAVPAEPVMVEELALEVEPAPAAVSPLMGTGPDYAMKPVAEWREIGEGELHWYAFDFTYWKDKDAPEMKPIVIRLYTDPFDKATLTVRDEHQAELWRQDGKQEHFGCCTPSELGSGYEFDKDGLTDYAIWSGQLKSDGRYYLVVEHAKNVSGPVRYMFTIEGDGITN